MADAINLVVDPDKVFQKALEAAIKEVDDLTIPFIQITKEWFQSNKFIFDLKGKGKWDDLSPGYKKQKQKNLGFVYPMFRASGALEKSITNPDAPGAIHQILNKTTLILGTNVASKKGNAPYPIYLQDGTGKMPARPFVMIGAEQTGPPQFNARRDAWILQLQSYVTQVAAQHIGEKG